MKMEKGKYETGKTGKGIKNKMGEMDEKLQGKQDVTLGNNTIR